MIRPDCLDCHGLGFSIDSPAGTSTWSDGASVESPWRMSSIEFECFQGHLLSKRMIAVDLKAVREVPA